MLTSMKNVLLIILLTSFSLASVSQIAGTNQGGLKKNSYDLSIPPRPIDSQIVQDQDDMIWDDYSLIPQYPDGKPFKQNNTGT